MPGFIRTACFIASVTTALTACGGRYGTAVTPPAHAVSALAPSTVAAQAAADTAPGSSLIVTSGGATCTSAGALFIACQGPAGSTATLTFTVPKGPLGYPPVSCGPVTWNMRKLFGKARSPRAHQRVANALGDAYHCGTATGSVTAVAPAAAGYPSAVESNASSKSALHCRSTRVLKPARQAGRCSSRAPGQYPDLPLPLPRRPLRAVAGEIAPARRCGRRLRQRGGPPRESSAAEDLRPPCRRAARPRLQRHPSRPPARRLPRYRTRIGLSC